MLFGIDEDDGSSVAGWVVPDHPSAEPAVIVAADEGGRWRVAASRYRRRLKEERLHATGLCGFVVDPASCPGLRDGCGLSIYEAGGNVLVYRRAPGASVPARLFHLETEPALPLDDLRALFQMSYGSVEFLGEESVLSILSIAFTPSVFVSGAVLYRRYEPYLANGGFGRSILLRDPARALAARLLRVREIARHAQAPGWRSLGLASLVEGFAEVDLADRAALARALQRLPEEAVLALADPLTRQLAARDSQEAARAEHVGTALDSLATFDVVGFEDDLAAFRAGLEALLGRDVPLGLDVADTPALRAVTVAVDGCGPALELVDLDRGLVAATRQALADARAPGRR